MDEQAVLFGPAGTLVGIVTTPDGGRAAPVACLLTNFGVTHRVGPHRLNVKLARDLASAGVASLRFDLSGIGDSAPPRHATQYHEQSVDDLRAAMDYLGRTLGVERFAVVGLCSGAVTGYAAALRDPRIVGLLIFDAFSYPTRASRMLRTWRRLLAVPFNPAIAEKTWRWAKRMMGFNRHETIDIFRGGSSLPSPEEFEQSMDVLVARGVSVYFIYTGTLHVDDRNRGLLGLFQHAPFMKRVRYEFMADVDHTVTPLAAQRKVMNAVMDWVTGIGRTPPASTAHDVRRAVPSTAEGGPAQVSTSALKAV